MSFRERVDVILNLPELKSDPLTFKLFKQFGSKAEFDDSRDVSNVKHSMFHLLPGYELLHNTLALSDFVVG